MTIMTNYEHEQCSSPRKSTPTQQTKELDYRHLASRVGIHTGVT
jgi:hypothetical protein